MISISSILFPVDLSEQSRAAAPFVQAMARRFRAEVTLLHVVEVPPAWYGPTGEASFSAWVDMSGMRESRRMEMDDFAAHELEGVRVQPCIQSGDPAATIHRVAHQKQVGLIMMPTHGYGPVRSLLLGSVTAKVLHDAECPVWTAMLSHVKCDPEAPWRRFLCAIDTDPKEAALVKWAAQLASEQGAELRLVHAISGFDQQQCNCNEDPLREFVFNIAEERIEKLQKEAGTHVKITVAAGRTGQAVRDLALSEQADLVLAGRGVIQKPLGRLRSNAYAIIRDAPCPVISL